MAILYKSDIERVNSCAEAALSSEVSDTDAIINNINDFTSQSATLTGKAWDKQRERFNSYLSALEKRKQVSELLLSTIKHANQIMTDYLAKFPWDCLMRIPDISIGKNRDIQVVDDSWRGDLAVALKKAQEGYENSFELKKDDSKDGNSSSSNKKSSSSYVPTSSTSYYEGVISACKTVINYLDELQPTAQKAYGEYDAVKDELANLKSLNHEINEALFDNGTRNKGNVVYVPVYGGGGSVNTSNETSNKTTNSTESTTVTQPINNNSTVTTPTSTASYASHTSTVAPSPTVNVTPTIVNNHANESNIDSEPEIEIVDEPIIDEPIINESDQPIVVDTPSVSTSSDYTRSTGNSTIKNIGIGVVGAAVAGAAAYGTYKTAKKIKENNDLDDEFSSDDEDYDDKENIDISYDKDDI